MYLYQSHMGGIYTSTQRYNHDKLYCCQCGDSDTYLGEFGSAIDFLKYFADEVDYNGSGGYDLMCLLEDLKCFDDCPSYEKAKRIVLENKTEECED